ncbi:MAG: hypothetical protein U0Z44_16120 [Kouleothrix sp.]
MPEGGAINYVDEGHGPAVLMRRQNPTWSSLLPPADPGAAREPP